MKSIDHFESSEATTSNVGIDIFQKLVALSRSADRTMADLSQWIINNQGRAFNMSITSLAQAIGASETTVFRFCRMLGLSGYKELRAALTESRGVALGAQLAAPSSSTDPAELDPMAATLRRVIDVNTEQLLKTLRLVSMDALRKAVGLLRSADHIHLVGFGSSQPVAFDAYQRFLCVGLTASAYSDPHILAAITANARPGALFFGISCSGRTRDVVEALETVGKRGLKRILITSDDKAPATKFADVVLISAVRRSPIASELIATRISQLAIVETLCVALAQADAESGQLARDQKRLQREIAKQRLPRRKGHRSAISHAEG